MLGSIRDRLGLSSQSGPPQPFTRADIQQQLNRIADEWAGRFSPVTMYEQAIMGAQAGDPIGSEIEDAAVPMHPDTHRDLSPLQKARAAQAGLRVNEDQHAAAVDLVGARTVDAAADWLMMTRAEQQAHALDQIVGNGLMESSDVLYALIGQQGGVTGQRLEAVPPDELRSEGRFTINGEAAAHVIDEAGDAVVIVEGIELPADELALIPMDPGSWQATGPEVDRPGVTVPSDGVAPFASRPRDRDVTGQQGIFGQGDVSPIGRQQGELYRDERTGLDLTQQGGSELDNAEARRQADQPEDVEGQGALFASRRLTSEQRRVRDAFEQLTADPARADAAYIALEETAGGKILGADHAKLLSPKYRQSRAGRAEYGDAVGPAAASYIRERLRRELDNPPQPGGGRTSPSLLITSGGPGSGKSYSLTPQRLSEHDLVWDTILAWRKDATSVINRARRNGWQVEVDHTYRPFEQAVDGVIERAFRTGRTMPIQSLPESHREAQRVAARLAERYADDPGVDVAGVMNVGDQAETFPIERVAEGGDLAYNDAQQQRIIEDAQARLQQDPQRQGDQVDRAIATQLAADRQPRTEAQRREVPGRGDPSVQNRQGQPPHRLTEPGDPPTLFASRRTPAGGQVATVRHIDPLGLSSALENALRNHPAPTTRSRPTLTANPCNAAAPRGRLGPRRAANR